ncbi:MAG: ATP-grasp domain-containing protein [Candidatus Eisenbacteria bacterium]|nr:ATP-grasp domain-containing protein [Candidatus Eisenbacteria bacterium]
MPNVIFVAPYFLETTLRFLEGAVNLPGARIGLISTDPESKLPPSIRGKLAGHFHLDDCLNPAELIRAGHAFRHAWGAVHGMIAALEELQVPMAEARDSLGVDGLSVKAAHHFRDKSRMKDVLRSHGIPCARHALADGEGAALDFAASCGYPLVVKPPAGAGARSTWRVNDEAELKRALAANPPSAERPVLLEEFVVGREHSFDSIMVDGELVWHSISCYYPTPLDVLENPWIQWSVLLPREIDGPEFDDIRTAAAKALKVLGLKTGLTHMEWFRRDDGSIAISEVAARPPGAQFTSLISYAHDLDFYSAWPRLMALNVFTPPTRRWSVGAAYLRGQGQGRVKAIHGIDAANREVGPLVVESKLPRPDEKPSGSYEGEGYVILRHPETSVVEAGLRTLVSTIRVELGSQ